MNEDNLWRPRPPSLYQPTGRVAKVPAGVLPHTLNVLRSAGNAEAACFWLGTLSDSGNGIVNAVVVPKQTNRRGNYEVPGPAMLEVANLARSRGWTIVVAVHSHPGLSVEHSIYDDHMTPSRRAVSVVFPNYGRWEGPWPSNVGVHEYSGNYWHLLPDNHAQQRIEFVADHSFETVHLR